jgi:tRNA-dihydrouridine synthase C
MLHFPTSGRPALVLAPMEGVTDAPMRAVQSERGAFSYCVSEFVRVTGTVLPAKVFLKSIPELRSQCATPNGTLVQVQLLGGDAGLLADSALVAVGLGAPAIDLNFGCPAPTVNRHDGGATLLKYPHRIAEIVARVRSAVPKHIPVSVKMRLGWDDTSPVLENASRAAAAGASWITIHGRTRNAGYQPPIFWGPIGEVRKLLWPLPIVANGDIWSLEDFKRCRDLTGCEHYMLGRGALADPNLAPAVAAELGLHHGLPSHGPFGAAPLDWLHLFERFLAHTPDRPDRSLLVARRVKQWSSLAERFGEVRWFAEIKRLPDFECIASTLLALNPTKQ